MFFLYICIPKTNFAFQFFLGGSNFCVSIVADNHNNLDEFLKNFDGNHTLGTTPHVATRGHSPKDSYVQYPEFWNCLLAS